MRLRNILPREIFDTWQDKYEWARQTVINGELQFYIDKENAVSLDNNLLRLVAEKQDTTIDGVTQPYNSGVFISKTGNDDAVTVMAGDYVEITCKLPHGAGLWPAFWLLRDDQVWDKTEIDILEGIAGTKEGRYHIAHHSHTAEGKTYQKLGQTVETGIDLTTTFNRYGVMLHLDRVDFYFNGLMVGSVDFHDHEIGLAYYMLINLAVAPTDHWAGGPADEYTWNEREFVISNIIIADSPVYDSTVKETTVGEVIENAPEATPEEEEEFEAMLAEVDREAAQRGPDRRANRTRTRRKKRGGVISKFIRVLSKFFS